MKLKLILAFFIFILLFFNSSFTKNNIVLTLREPSGREIISLTGKPLYLMGIVSPAQSQITINGVNAEVDVDGAFICYSPVIVLNEKDSSGNNKGKFVFKIKSGNQQKEIEKNIWIKLPPKTSSSERLEIDNNWSIQPYENLTLQIGEIVYIEIKATPGCQGYFNIKGIREKFPLTETSFINSFYWGDAVFGDGLTSKGTEIKGIYKGHFVLNENLENANISITLEHPVFGIIKKTTPGKISTLQNRIRKIVKTKYDPNLTIGRNSPGGGYRLFLPDGTKLEVIGRQGNWLKTKLSENESIFVSSYSVNFLPDGTPPPISSVRIVRTKEFEKYTSVELDISEKLPFIISQFENPQRIELLVYNTISDIDWIFYDRKSNFIKEIKHSQLKDGVLKLEILLNQRTHWGYKPEYDGNILKLKINKPAKRNSRFLFWENQLEGRVIVLDPGHTSDYGATGPRGTREKDVNYQISITLKEMLEDAGAIVHLTHEKNQDLKLTDRKAKVNSFNPEISISIHNNAVPQGVNPINHNGSSVYYFYSQALPLAKLIHRNFLDNLELKDFGLYWDNLYMCRIPESIALLVEPAFMIVPEQERLLGTQDFQYKIAESIYDALEKFYEEYSE